MKNHALFGTLCLAALVCSNTTLAQQSGSKFDRQTTSTSAASAEQTSAQQPRHVRLSTLLGANVKSSDGQSLGEIEDIVVNPGTGQIELAIVGKGGFLGMGEKRVPVPWPSVSVSKSPDEGLLGKPNLTVNLDREKLQSGPTMQKDKQFSELNQPDYLITIYRFYEIEPIGVGGTGQGSQTQGDSQQNTKQSEQK